MHKDLLQRPLQVNMAVLFLLGISDKHVLPRLLHNDVMVVLFFNVLPHKDVFIGAMYPRMALPPRSARLAWRSAPASPPRIGWVIVWLSARSASRPRYVRRLSWVALVAFVALNRICWVALVALLAFC